MNNLGCLFSGRANFWGGGCLFSGLYGNSLADSKKILGVTVICYDLLSGWNVTIITFLDKKIFEKMREVNSHKIRSIFRPGLNNLRRLFRSES